VTSIGHYHYENMNFGLCRILLAIINGNIDKDFKIPGPPPNTLEVSKHSERTACT
jgi:hypothetical protein